MPITINTTLIEFIANDKKIPVNDDLVNFLNDIFKNLSILSEELDDALDQYIESMIDYYSEDALESEVIKLINDHAKPSRKKTLFIRMNNDYFDILSGRKNGGYIEYNKYYQELKYDLVKEIYYV